jgi:hypothetical protein
LAVDSGPANSSGKRDGGAGYDARHGGFGARAIASRRQDTGTNVTQTASFETFLRTACPMMVLFRGQGVISSRHGEGVSAPFSRARAIADYSPSGGGRALCALDAKVDGLRELEPCVALVLGVDQRPRGMLGVLHDGTASSHELLFERIGPPAPSRARAASPLDRQDVQRCVSTAQLLSGTEGRPQKERPRRRTSGAIDDNCRLNEGAAS